MILLNNPQDNAVQKLVNNMFQECAKNTLYISTSIHSDIDFKQMSNCPKWNYHLNSYFNNSNSKLNFYYFLIITFHDILNKTVLQDILNEEDNIGIFDPLMKIVIIVNNILENALEEKLIEVFDMCWKMHFVHVTIACNRKNVFKIFTYNPFLRQLKEIYKANIKYFERNILNNFHRYPLRTEAIYDKPYYVPMRKNNKTFATGMSKYFSEELCHHFNATEVHRKLHGRHLKNLTHNLLNNESDICINLKGINKKMFHGTEYVYPIFRNDLCVIVPEILSNISIQRIQNIITLDIFGLILGIVFVSALLWYGQNKFDQVRQRIIDNLFKILALMTNVSTPIINTSLRISEKILWSAWFVFGILITSTFNAVFFRAMLTPGKTIDLSTPEKIVANGNKIY